MGAMQPPIPCPTEGCLVISMMMSSRHFSKTYPRKAGRGGLSPATVRLWFHRLSPSLKMDGCSSHSGRRTFITRAARTVSQVGGSLRDVQELAGHTSLAMTQRYIEGDTEAKRKLVALL